MNDHTFAHLPAGWSWSRFDEIGSVSLGRQRSPANHSGPAMRPYVRAANITWTGLDLTDVKEMNFDEADFARFRLQPGDVLINEGSGSASEVGKPVIWRGEIADCCFQNTLLRVQPKACSSEYVFNYIQLSAKSGQFVSSTQGVNIFHIGREGLARQVIPVPPLPEQRRIVAKIDTLSAKSRRARYHLDYIPTLVERYRAAVLDVVYAGFDNHAALENLVDSDRGIPYGIIQTGDPYEGGIPTVRCGDIQSFRVGLESLKRVSPEIECVYERTRLRGGEVLIAVRGSVGETCVATEDMRGINISREVAMIPVTHDIDPHFIMYYLASPKAQRMINANVKGVAQQGINLRDLRALPTPHTGIENQRAVVRRIVQAFAWIDRLAAEATTARALLDRLDKSVLAKAFRGELVPQDPADEPASALLERVIAAKAGAAPMGRRRGRPPKAALL